MVSHDRGVAMSCLAEGITRHSGQEGERAVYVSLLGIARASIVFAAHGYRDPSLYDALGGRAIQIKDTFNVSL